MVAAVTTAHRVFGKPPSCNPRYRDGFIARAPQIQIYLSVPQVAVRFNTHWVFIRVGQQFVSSQTDLPLCRTEYRSTRHTDFLQQALTGYH